MGDGGAMGASAARPMSGMARSPFAPRADSVQNYGGADDELLRGLTPNQKAAALHVDGPLLVLAGPGSGKTRVITRRIAHLVRTGVRPWRILALTFTNKAAGEMRHRVADLLGGADSQAMRGLTVTTFHSLCVRLLRRYCELGGLAQQGLLKPEFSIYDSDDQAKLIKRVISDLQLNTSNFPPRTVLSTISQAKNELIDAREYAQRAQDFYTRSVAKIYATYQAALRSASACDFDDLLLLTAQMLRQSEAVRTELNARYRYLLIDEYQDTNRAQFLIASLIAGSGVGPGGVRQPQNICAVGDPDQSIYGWRGADISNILQFEQNFPNSKVIALGENFRSRAPILAVADRLIKRNLQRKNKPLVATRGDGEKIRMTLCRDEHHEARLVGDWIASLTEKGENGQKPACEYKDFAIFYRTNALSRVIEDELRKRGMPYTIVRGTAFFDREEIRTALAYLRVIANPADDVSLERVVNTPARGIGDTTFEKYVQAAGERMQPVLQTLRDPNAVPGLAARATGAVARFVQLIDAWAGNSKPASDEFMGASVERGEVYGSLPDLVERVIRESGLENMYRAPGEEERLENLAELVSSAKDFEDTLIADADIDPETGEARVDEHGRAAPEKLSLMAKLQQYLTQVALVADVDGLDQSRGAVTLMTLHAAKGLEFPCVAMVGLEEGCLPHSRAQTSETELEEERRLCFVGATRAMERLHITSATFRTIRGLSERTIASRFLEELNGPEVLISDQSDPFASHDDGDCDQGGFDDDFGGGVSGGFGRSKAYGRSSGGGGFGGGASRAGKSSFASGGASRSGSAGGGSTSGASGSGGGAGGGGGGGGGEWAKGVKVRHPQFGVGEIKAYIPGATPRVTVEFKGVGVKTLVIEYARLTRM